MPTPATVTETLLEDTPWFARYHFTGSFIDTQETLALKVDSSTWNYIRAGVTTPRASISRIQYNCAGSGVVNLYWDANTRLLAHSVSGQGDLILDADANIYNAAGAGVTGDIKITTTGFTSGQTYDVTVTLRKNPADVCTATRVTALDIVDSHAGVYVTGDTLRVKASFDQVVYVESARSYIKFTLDSGVIEARYRGNQTVSAVKTGSGTPYAVFEYTFKAHDGASAGYMSVTSIDKTIHGSEIGWLPVVDSLPAIAGIAGFTVNEHTGVLKTQTGKARITVHTAKTATGKGRVTVHTAQTQTGTANIGTGA